MPNILCIIPARSGSKSLPHKNVKLFNGKPLLAWSIEQAKRSKYDMKIIVSTDSKGYQDIALQYGGECPFLRPREISGDLSTDYECIEHCLKWLKQNQYYIPDIVLHLRPTQPLRKIKDIDKALDVFIENMSKYDSLRSVTEFDKSPYKMYTVENELLVPLFKTCGEINEPYNQCRQLLPKTYLHNGYIDVFKTSIIKNGTISGNKIYPFLMEKTDCIDIDTIDDWKKAIIA